MSACYDTVIIGAGIAGATIAYTLTKQHQKVLVLDKNGIASGGSGAAGAFVSPKIGKGSPLQRLTNEAFLFAKDFYLIACPELFHQTGVIRIPKNEEDAKNFQDYEAFNLPNYETYTPQMLHDFGIKAAFESFYFPDAGDCDAPDVCTYLLKEIEVVSYVVGAIRKEDAFWVVGKYKTKNIVLATGHESDLLDLRYMGIRGTWGTRGDFSSRLDLPVSMHQSISVGANRDGVIKLGATHEKMVKEVMPCSDEQALGLKQKASALVDTSDFELLQSYCGMRAGSKDYFPLVGRVINTAYMLGQYPDIVRGAKAPLKHVENLYILNGLGGRGFVFAPLMAKWLAELIIEGKVVDTRVDPDRLFLKWARKMKPLSSSSNF